MVDVAERTTDNVFKLFFPAVNSPPVPHRDITGTSTESYRPYNEDYIQMQRRIEKPSQPDVDNVERPKKDKKWSIGKLFRRKKKEDDSGSSSESDEGVSSLSPSKKKIKKKKRAQAVNNFDHIVIRDTRRAQSLAKPNIRDITDDGVLSDPSAGFINYYRTDKKKNNRDSKESLTINDDYMGRPGKPVSEVSTRKTRKGRLKARVEALRNSMKGDSSSDEESLKSSNSSSMVRFRSEDSLMRSRDSSLNKKSRNARNERYIKRLSRDEENQLNKEAELLQQGYTKAEVEMLTRTPTSQSSGYGTCKRDQTNNTKAEQTFIVESNRRPKCESISSFPSNQSYPSSINFNAKVNNENLNYTIQYPTNNTNRESVHANNNRERLDYNEYDNTDSVICVKFPLGNVTNIKKEDRAPPVPPPRDMHRKVATPISMYYENNPITSEFRVTGSNVIHGVPNNDFERIMRRSQERSIGNNFNGLRRPLSNSVDHIAMQNNEYMQHLYLRNEQPRRPASVSAEPHHYGQFMNAPYWKKNQSNAEVLKPEPVQAKQDYLYYADQSPRSRRPISIKNNQTTKDHQYMSDSQVSNNITDKNIRKPRNASEFWKKLDNAEKQRKQYNNYINFRNNSESCPQNHKNIQNIQRKEINDCGNRQNQLNYNHEPNSDRNQMWISRTEYKRAMTVEPPKLISPSKSHVRHKSDTFVTTSHQPLSDEEKSSERRKSTNLDDALNELEAIYNSLGLGDEDLLDRAERRELMTPKFNESFHDWNGNDNEIQLRSQPTTPLRRITRRSTLPDKLQDDMAFRRMNSLTKEKNNCKETQGQISYMLASPVYVPYASDDDRHIDTNEPDIIYDDVVYRNIKQTNNRLKTIDPQPPFGIPVGPVSPAPQSDYLHATPETNRRSRFVPRRSPDLVSDDLAYRSLRKDNRHSSLFSSDDYNGPINNNHPYSDISFTKDSSSNLKKKRAVRSLSANIFSMIQKEIDDALNMSKVSTIQKTSSNSDVMRRLRDTFESNDSEKDRYPRNKVKQRHNTVSIFVNNTHTPIHNFAKDDSFINSDAKTHSKSLSCDKSKSSSPSNQSPQTFKRSSKDEFQHVLTMLAQEAMDTSNKLGVALAELDKNRSTNEKQPEIQTKISDSRLHFLNGLTSNLGPEFVPPQPKPLNIVDSSKVKIEQNKAQKTEDSLLVISDQLNKVEDQLKQSIEKEINCDIQNQNLSNFKTKTEEKLKTQELPSVSSDHKQKPNIEHQITENRNRSETINDTKCAHGKSLNPFLDSSYKLKEIDEINAFRELKDGISDLIAGISQVNEKIFLPKCNTLNDNNINSASISGITEASEKLNEVSQMVDKEKPPNNRTSVNLSIYEDDVEMKKDTADSTEYNSSEELASIFKQEAIQKSASTVEENGNENSIRDDLSSPKLVHSINQHLRRLSVDNSEDSNSSQSNSLPNNIVPWRMKRQNNSQKENRGGN